jgi:hypothetical protein
LSLHSNPTENQTKTKDIYYQTTKKILREKVHFKIKKNDPRRWSIAQKKE